MDQAFLEKPVGDILIDPLPDPITIMERQAEDREGCVVDLIRVECHPPPLRWFRAVSAGASCIPPPLLHRGKLHQRSDRLPFIRMLFAHHLPARANAPPFAHKACATKQIRLDAHAVEAAHVAQDRSAAPAGRSGRFPVG